MIDIIGKLEIIAIIQVNIEVQQMVFGVMIIILLQNNQQKGLRECLGENTEKYNTYSVPIEKEVTKIDKVEIELYRTKSIFLIVQDLW